ncbi:aspartic peptidase domain-containing protein [Favolaschia claudopus]|uniref:Aspartic peptidase domain-containing protein n=1 Tax=Favolaschia claudopus TaxID=2862362 RepID=A0AAW0A873_9AGAR
MFLLIWLVSGSIVSSSSPAYGEPVHLPLIRQVLSHSDSAVSRSLLGVERRNRADEQYLIPISLGTPTQIIPLVLSFNDPGTIVVGCNLDSKSCSSSVGTETLFNYSDSSSAQNKSTSMQTITPLGAAPIPGSVFTDVIGFGPFSVLDASFFVIQNYSGATASATFGLGFPDASFQNLPSIWQSLLSTNPVDAPEMGIWLSRLHNTSGLGVFTFGGTNSSLYTGDIEFLNSTSTSFWALNITTLTIQGREITLTQSRNNNVIFEVAATGIYGPISSVAAIWAQVPGASPIPNHPGAYQYPCSTALHISVSFGGRSWTLDPAELNGGSHQTDWNFGQPFLRGVYTVLRQGSPPQIGFADLSEQGDGASSGSASLPPSSTAPPRSTPPPVSARASPVAAVYLWPADVNDRTAQS